MDARLQKLALPLLWTCAACVLFGGYLRVQQLGFPPQLTFDEHHFVENARNYLAGRPDWNDHPPLGKLLIACAIDWFGDTPAAWRASALASGLLNIALAFAAGLGLFRDRLAAALAAAFFALDGFLIAYSRTALLDGLCLSFELMALLALARGPSALGLVLAGVAAGFGSSIKLSGVAIFLPIAVAAFVWTAPLARRIAVLAASSAAALAVYVVEYAIGLDWSGAAATPAAVMTATLAMVKHHAALTQMTHPLVSRFYTWFVPLRPITLRYQLDEGGLVRAMTTLGNPLLWWASSARMLAGLCGFTWRGLRALAGRGVSTAQATNAPAPPDSATPQRWPELVLYASFAGFLLPWMLTGRDSYIYHYLPSYGVALIALAGSAAKAFRRAPLGVLCGLLVVAEVSVFYAPVWAQLPLSEAAFGWRLFLTRWR